MNKDYRPNPFDLALQEGAWNAINICLRLKPSERITLITDRFSREIADALLFEILQVGAEARVFLLEDYVVRPMRHMPRAVLESLALSQVSIFAAQALEHELNARMEMMQVVNEHHLRHGHMVNISKQIMTQGMRADFNQIDRLSTRLVNQARATHRIHATSPGGTDIEAEFSPQLRWIKTSGIITPEKWGNLPGGEIFTSPLRVDGVFVVDGVVGDYLCAKYGDLKETPLSIEIENSRIRALHCENKQLLEEFSTYISTDENSNRVGEFAIGTNLAIHDVIGNILQDEKIPGIHIAFGHPYSEHTGQSWFSSSHIDCVGRAFNIWMDGELIMEQGQFVGFMD